MIRGTIIVDQERCKGCELCTHFCPQDVMMLDPDKLNAKGYHPAMLLETNEQVCTGCSICAVVCPDVAITVLREPKKTRQAMTA